MVLQSLDTLLLLIGAVASAAGVGLQRSRLRRRRAAGDHSRPRSTPQEIILVFVGVLAIAAFFLVLFAEQ
jgi:hypothetical protein